MGKSTSFNIFYSHFWEVLECAFRPKSGELGEIYRTLIYVILFGECDHTQ